MYFCCFHPKIAKAIVSKWAIVSKLKKALFQELFRGFKASRNLPVPI